MSQQSESAVATFLQTLGRSRLLASDRWQAIERAVQQSDSLSPEVLAGWLVQQGWITSWQRDKLLAGCVEFHLGRYKLLAHLGSGGMGAVFKAEQQPLGRIVAVKLMSERLVRDPHSLARFRREMQVVAVLDHPNIVQAYDADSLGGTHFLVMELIPGQSLEEILQSQGVFRVPDACELVRQTALGLQHAFEHGLIHRDIKPSNLLLTRRPSGRPLIKILDFGLALLHDSATAGTLTGAGEILGTPDYISPEQAQNTHAADTRSDIYSLGCTAFRMITGTLPFEGRTSVEKLWARGMRDAPRLREFRTDVPPEVESIVRRMLERDPDQRYQTPAELARELSEFLSASGAEINCPVLDTPDCLRSASFDTPYSHDCETHTKLGPAITVWPETFSPPAERDACGAPLLSAARERSGRARRHFLRALVPVIAGIAMSLALIAALWAWTARGETTLVVDWPEFERKEAWLEIDGHRQPLAKGARLAFAGPPGERRLRAGRAGFETVELSAVLGRGETRQVALKWEPTPETSRRQEIRRLQQQARSLASSILEDGRSAALWDAAVAARHRFRRTPEGNAAARLLSQIASPLDVLPPVDSPERPAVPVIAVLGDERCRHPGGTTCFTISPDGTLIATGGADSRIHLWRVPGGEYVRTLSGHGLSTIDIQFSTDGRRLYAQAYSAPGGVASWDLADGGRISSFRAENDDWYGGDFAVSRDERWLAGGGVSGTVYLWDLQSTARPRVLKHHCASLWGLQFSPDGRTLVTRGKGPAGHPRAQESQSVAVWDTEAATLRQSLDGLPPGPGAFSCDADLVAVGSGADAEIWNILQGKSVQSLPTSGAINFLAFSPDCRTLGTCGPETCLWDWKAGTRMASAAVRPFVAGTRPLEFVPGGESLFVFSEDNRLHVLSGSARSATTRFQPSLCSAAVSNDGRQVYLGTSSGEVLEHRLADGTQRVLFTGLNGRVHSLAPDPRRPQMLAAAESPGSGVGLWLLDRTTGEVRPQTFEATGSAVVRYSPEGDFWALGRRDGTVRVFDASNGSVACSIPYPKEVPQAVRTLDWSPDARLLATGHADGSVHVWDVARRRHVSTWRAHPERVNAVLFSDPQAILSTGQNGSIDRWNLADLSRPAPLKFALDEVRHLALSPDQELLLAGTHDGRLLVVGLQGQRPAELNIGARGGIQECSWFPDSRHALIVTDSGTARILRLRPRQ